MILSAMLLVALLQPHRSLTVAPIGIAVAVERYVLAVGTTLLVLFVLRVMHRIEMYRTKRPVQ